MGHALKLSETSSHQNVIERERGVTAAHLRAVESDLRNILQTSGVFQSHEINAIISAVVTNLKMDGVLRQARLATELHSKGLSKDFSRELSKVLSSNI